jgi:hypothetical protein
MPRGKVVGLPYVDSPVNAEVLSVVYPERTYVVKQDSIRHTCSLCLYSWDTKALS